MVSSGVARPKFFTPKEVEIHNTIQDVWVSYLGRVYNLTPLCEQYAGMLTNIFLIKLGVFLIFFFSYRIGSRRY